MNTHLELLAGKPYIINEDLFVKNVTLRNIIDMEVNTYLTYVDFLTVEPYDIGDILWYDNNVWYEDLTAWDLFLSRTNSDPKAIQALIELTNYNETSSLDESGFNEIAKAIKLINCMPPRERIASITNRAVKLSKLERMQYDRNKPEKARFKSYITFDSMVSSVAWLSNSINIFNVWDLNIYQFHEGFKRICAKDEYDKIMGALYAGTQFEKPIDKEKIFFANDLSKE